MVDWTTRRQLDATSAPEAPSRNLPVHLHLQQVSLRAQTWLAASRDRSASYSPLSANIVNRTINLFRPSPAGLLTRSLPPSVTAPASPHAEADRKSSDLDRSLSEEVRLEYLRTKMAFAFGNAGGSVASNTQTRDGNDLEEVTTETLGFSALAGEKKLRLLPSPWPANSLPPPTSSLLSIASRKGLLAAAAPDTLIVATTESIRQTFTGDGPEENKIMQFSPQATIPVPRVSQVAFTADEKYLVISAENGGGLAVFDVQSILQGNKDSAFQIGTNGISVRALVPNPSLDNPQYVSLVLTGGQLMLANLNDKQLVNGPNGPVLKEGVSCVSWSVRGKQLVAGLGNGVASQIKPDGVVVADIPRPPKLQGEYHVSSIDWLANDEFLTIYTPTAFDPDRPPDSEYYFIQREKGTQNYTFHKFLTDPAPPFGLNRSPPHHFITRLRKFPPSLDDMLIVASTASEDIGLFTRSTVPLAEDQPITNIYTTTGLANDSRRAQLPLSLDTNADIPSTSPIGMTLDLSSKTLVKRPIPAEEEINESPTPLPALMVLNNEGVLCAWWVVYNDSIKQKTGYPELVALEESGLGAPQQQPQSTLQASPFSAQAAQPAPSPFANALGKSTAPAFGASGFSGTGAAPTFGGSSTMGEKKSVWGPPAVGSSSSSASTSAFGKPAFGSATPFGASGFGAVGALGNRASPWATSGTGSAPTASKPSEAPAASAWAASSASGSSPFSSLGGGASGFASLGQKATLAKPAFASSTQPMTTPTSSFGMSSEPSFGTTVTIGSGTGGSTTSGFLSWTNPSVSNTPAQTSSSPFAQSSFASQATQESDMGDADDQAQNRVRDEVTPTPQIKPATGLFGAGNSGFKLTPSFKGDGTAKDDLPKPANGDSSSFFGSPFTSSLEEKTVTPVPAVPVTPIKTEPGIEEIKLSNISTTPASPPKPTAPKLSDVGKSAPLSQIAEKPVQVPSKQPVRSATPPVAEEPAPLPPDFISEPKQSNKEFELPPLAGSPPVEIQAPDSSPYASPLPSIDDPEIEEHDDEVDDKEDEKSDVETASLAPAEKASKTPSWGFNMPSSQPLPRAPDLPKPESVISNQSWAGAKPPALPSIAPSTTPMGFPKPAPFLPPPGARLREPPRSPSPVRSASTPVGIRRSVIASAAPPHRQVAPPPAQPVQPSLEELSDEEDERTRAELRSEIHPTLTLEPFIAHQDYVGQTTKPGIPGQVERVYRDINAMIDTLGLNSRHLAAFIKGHSELLSQHGRSREDIDEIGLEDESVFYWRLAELEDLAVIQQEMDEALDSGRVTDVQKKLAELALLQRDLARLRTRSLDLRKLLAAHRDANSAAVLQAAPLSAEQVSQQRALRASFAELQKLIREAEDNAVLLRAKLASAEAERGKSGGQGTPTVEAVTSTIMKMTSMIERKSGDIDLLETQMRKLRMSRTNSASPAPPTAEEDSLIQRSRENSPFVTPPSIRHRTIPNSAASSVSRATSALGRSFGLFHTPDSSPAVHGRHTDSVDAPVDQAVVKEYLRRVERQRAIKNILVEQLSKRRGVKSEVVNGGKK